MTDGELAKKLDISIGAVFFQRKKRGIPPARRRANSRAKNIDWDKEPLGKMTDTAIAKKHGVSITAVHMARKKRGIPALGQRSKVDWDAQPFGEVRDSEIADRVGVSRERVRQMRARRGIPPYHEKLDKKLKEQLENIGVVGTISDSAIENAFGIPRSKIVKFRKENKIGPAPQGFVIDWDEIDWEGKSDGEIAQMTGVPQEVVGRRRRKAGIPAQRKAEPGKDLRKGIDWDAQPLGKISDAELSKKLGVSRHTVYQSRKGRGIPAAWRKKKKSK